MGLKLDVAEPALVEAVAEDDGLLAGRGLKGTVIGNIAKFNQTHQLGIGPGI